MGINFPPSPDIGDLYPDPAIAGLPQYMWDGIVWVATVQEPLTFVSRMGDTMTGHLSLPASPAADNAVRKDYVDSAIAAIPPPIAAATSAEYLSNSAPTKLLTSGATWGAAPYATITDGATLTINLSLGINFLGTIGTGRTMANPTNGKPGQTGIIVLVSGTVTAWGTSWKFPGGIKPIMSNGADFISYFVGGDSTSMFCTASIDLK